LPDYAHDLAFGTFLTADVHRPDHVVALAQLTERVGLELATFQDHPYQPALLDTWTLMAWVLAGTRDLRVAPNVLNVALRQPAMIARSAATLDLLSNGRVELGLGAGAFWDAIAAMGGPRRTLGQGIDALREAIDVICGFWNVSAGPEFWLEGKYYSIEGAARGPAPAHDLEVWLGAYGPRMLRLTGQRANGWLPTLHYLQSTPAAANRVIDEAAVAAGRVPADIRRLLNVRGSVTDRSRGAFQGPPSQWVEELLPLALDDGFSVFLLMSDDPRSIQRFGEEVAPALREAVAAERRTSAGSGASNGRVRDAAALARRVPGIDYDGVPPALAAGAVEPGDRDYPKVRSTHVRRGSPALVLRPDDADGVRAALDYARAQDVTLSVRSGGHGVSGRSTNDGGIVIDLGRLDQVEVLDGSRVRLGPGARWGNVARALAPHGLGMSSGDYGDVGVGGLATAGGVGLLARRHGLTIDHVVAAEVVLASGDLVRVDADNDPDLLWAIRGAGGNFGIVTAFELEAYEVSDVILSTMAFGAADTARLLTLWGEAIEAAPRELTSFLSLFATGGAPIAQLHSVYAGDDVEAAAAALRPLMDLGPVLHQDLRVLDYPSVVPVHGGIQTGADVPGTRCGLLHHVTAEAAGALTELLAVEAPLIQVRSVGGAVNDVPADATAYAHRTQNFCVNAVGTTAEGLNERWDRDVHPLCDGLYLSFDTDQRPERLQDAFPGETLERLKRLKAIYDPDNLFDRNFPIAGIRGRGSSQAPSAS
jgi:alkanesulfonate monooxygenase SsuD/methylene tetrahydromethanopterin reductase-like flavin-dependent oxidoreductase (luciferase family)/FAD/FMN-containing dehydrogenase